MAACEVACKSMQTREVDSSTNAFFAGPCVARCRALRDLLKVVRLLHTSIHTIICEHN